MEFQKDQAIYLQIADMVFENILAGLWSEDDKIPSVRVTAVTLEVNPNTVMRTYTYLQEKGLIYNRRGIGYFIAQGALEKTKILEKEEFIQNHLPQLFKMMDLLNIDFNELRILYDSQH
ncbi:MAG TPA: GntR family transcriptional regulator [Candidatus Marinimicrobia bacterium]|nr:GntR family transcriptional regulator [Candidatus Neomarinimicrobiota bacterium]